MGFAAAEIARRFGLTLQGDGTVELKRVCTLAPGSPDGLAYMSDDGHLDAMTATRAGAVIVAERFAEFCPSTALVADDPKLAFARVATLFLPPPPPPGIVDGACVAADAAIDPSAHVAMGAVVEAGAHVAAGAVLEAGCVIGRDAVVGPECRIEYNAVVGHGVRLQARVRVGGGAILGGRGFGLVQDGENQIPIPQLGSVTIGEDVEIGAGCTIDRGAIEDTIVEAGVKLDDQVHIGHNCHIGARTVIAGCTGVAGSSHIGRGCMIGGGVGIGDHVTIAAGVMITGATQVPGDIDKPGVYSSTLWPMPAGEWRRRMALLRKLDRTEKRLRILERAAQDKGENV